MSSFYGGHPGLDFKISHIFDSYYGEKNSLLEDIKKVWTSPIAVGEYVAISYGLPSDNDYNEKRLIDLDATEGLLTYNSTIWLKVVDNTNAPGYKLLASMTGNTPEIEISYDGVKENGEFGEDVLNSDESPNFIKDLDSTIDAPRYTILLPAAVEWSSEYSIVNANNNPSLEINTTGARDLKKTISFKLPSTRLFSIGNITRLHPGSQPNVETTVEGSLSDLIKFNFTLPNSLTISKDDNFITIVPASNDIDIALSGSYTSEDRKLSFKIPKTRSFVVSKNIVNAEALPNISLTWEDSVAGTGFKDLGNLHFNLPKPLSIKGNFSTLLPNQSPEASLAFGGCYNAEGTLTIKLPDKQVFAPSLISTEVLDAGASPNVTLVGNESSTELGLKFSLPGARSFVLDNTEIINVDCSPTVVLIWDENGNIGTFKFALPRSQNISSAVIMGSACLAMILPPKANMQVFLDKGDADDNWLTDGIPNGTIDNPVLKFKMPRNAKWFSGNYPDLNQNFALNGIITLDHKIDNMDLGDYYFHQSGALWELSRQSGISSYDYKYLGRFEPPALEATIETKSSLESASVQLIAPNETNKNYTYKFSIPRGTRIYLGDSTPPTLPGNMVPVALNGDIYINTVTGVTYSTDGTSWSETGNIKGPMGSSIKFVGEVIEWDGGNDEVILPEAISGDETPEIPPGLEEETTTEVTIDNIINFLNNNPDVANALPNEVYTLLVSKYLGSVDKLYYWAYKAETTSGSNWIVVPIVSDSIKSILLDSLKNEVYTKAEIDEMLRFNNLANSN